MSPLPHIQAPFRKAAFGATFWLVVAYYAVEYIRPHDYYRPLWALHPGLVMTVLLAVAWLAGRDKSALREPIIRLFMAFILLCAVSILFAANNYWAYFTTRMLAVYLIGGVLPLIAFLSDPAKLSRFFVIWVGIHVIVAAAATFHGHGRGPGNFLKDENDLALALDVAIPYAYFLMQAAPTLTRRLIYLGSLGMLVAGVIATDSRGGFVGLVAATGGILLFSKRRVRNLLALACVGVAVLVWAPPAYFQEIETITDTSDSTRVNRLYLWRRAWEMYRDYPILGVGASNYPWRVEGYEMRSPEYDPEGRSMGGRVSHSLFFTLIPEMGTVGTLVYAAMVYLVFGKLRRISRLGAMRARPPPPEVMRLVLMARAEMASLLAFFASGAFLSVLYYPHFWYATAFALALDRVVHGTLAAAEREAEVAALAKPEPAAAGVFRSDGSGATW